MNYFSKEKKAYKKEVKKANNVLTKGKVNLSSKGIPAPAKLPSSLVAVKKTKIATKVFKK